METLRRSIVAMCSYRDGTQRCRAGVKGRPLPFSGGADAQIFPDVYSAIKQWADEHEREHPGHHVYFADSTWDTAAPNDDSNNLNTLPQVQDD